MNCKKCNKEHDGFFGSGEFCSRGCANSRNHSTATKEKISQSNKKRVQKKCICGVSFETTPKSKAIYHTNACKYKDPIFLEKFSSSLRGKTGGFRERGGRGKCGTYEGYYYQSTWELAYIVFNLDNNVSFIRNTKEKFSYEYDGRKYNYYPDFKLNENTFVEIKGYYTSKVRAKLKSLPVNKKLIIIDKSNIKPYLDYLAENYAGLV